MQTRFLAFAYRDLGMLEKAVAEGFEQWELLERTRRERKTHATSAGGVMPIWEVLDLKEQLEKQRQSQKKQ